MDKIIGAVIGLIGVIGNHGKTEQTDQIIIEALANCESETDAETIYQKVVAERNRISPGCASCGSPCGNTSDYDMRKIDEMDEEKRTLAKEMIAHVCSTAACFAADGIDLKDLEIIINQMYVCLTCIAQDASTEEMADEFGVMQLLFSSDDELEFDFDDDEFDEDFDSNIS